MCTDHQPLVLIIEDDESICDVYQEVLTDSGIRVLTARKLAPALNLINVHQSAIDALVVDADLKEPNLALPHTITAVELAVALGVKLIIANSANSNHQQLLKAAGAHYANPDKGNLPDFLGERLGK